MIAGIKDVHDAKVGDTVTHAKHGAAEPLPGYKEVKPMVYSGLYPTDSEEFENLRDALEKFHLNDSALILSGGNFRCTWFRLQCGFLGLLHMEIVQERLFREYNQSIITTLPNVEYLVYKRDNEKIVVDNPALMPPVGDIEYVEGTLCKSADSLPERICRQHYETGY